MSNAFNAMGLSQPDELLTALYASAVQPALWRQSLDRLCADMGARSAVVQAFTFDAGIAQVHWTEQDSWTVGHAADRVPNALAHGNPRLSPQRALRGLNRLVTDEMLFDPGDDACPTFQQRMAHLGFGRFVGALQEVRKGVYLAVALHRHSEDPTDFSHEHLRRLSDVAPHLGQAFLLTDQHAAAHARDLRLHEFLDQVHCGLVLCDSLGRVQWVNRMAAGLLGDDGPLMQRGDHLQGHTPAETRRLLAELAAVSHHDAVGSVRYLRMAHERGAVHLAIQASESIPGVLVVISSGAMRCDVSSRALECLFDLTPTEARVLHAIATGRTLEDYAAQRGVTVGTARVQLKQVQSKMGEHRQSDLVRLVLSSAAAHWAMPSRMLNG